MDHLIRTRSSEVAKILGRDEVQQQIRAEIAKVIREEIRRALPNSSQ